MPGVSHNIQFKTVTPVEIWDLAILWELGHLFSGSWRPLENTSILRELSKQKSLKFHRAGVRGLRKIF